MTTEELTVKRAAMAVENEAECKMIASKREATAAGMKTVME